MKPKYNNIQQILEDVALTPYQKETEKLLLYKKFSQGEVATMFRLLRDLAKENEQCLHYSGGNYRRYLLESVNEFVNSNCRPAIRIDKHTHYSIKRYSIK